MEKFCSVPSSIGGRIIAFVLKKASNLKPELHLEDAESRLRLSQEVAIADCMEIVTIIDVVVEFRYSPDNGNSKYRSWKLGYKYGLKVFVSK